MKTTAYGYRGKKPVCNLSPNNIGLYLFHSAERMAGWILMSDGEFYPVLGPAPGD